MRGLLLLSDPHYGRISPGCWIAECGRLGIKVQWKEAAADQPSLLCAFQTALCRLREDCGWVCVLAEGFLAAYGLALAEQLNVDRLILMGGQAFRREGVRRSGINAFARRNLSLITAELIAVEMDEKAIGRLSSGLGYHCGGLLRLKDAAQLWQKRESFLTAPFSTLAD